MLVKMVFNKLSVVRGTSPTTVTWACAGEAKKGAKTMTMSVQAMIGRVNERKKREMGLPIDQMSRRSKRGSSAGYGYGVDGTAFVAGAGVSGGLPDGVCVPADARR